MSGDDVYVLAPRLGVLLHPGWKDAVAALSGVRVLGRDGPGMQISATPEAAAILRALFGGALRVEPVRPRSG